jgi:hypothetical protein
MLAPGDWCDLAVFEQLLQIAHFNERAGLATLSLLRRHGDEGSGSRCCTAVSGNCAQFNERRYSAFFLI